MALAGIAYACYGLFAHFDGGEKILWLDKWAYIGDLSSTFVNRNAYAAYAGLGMVCCLALFAKGFGRSVRGRGAMVQDRAEALVVEALPYLGGAGILATALVLTHSRAGLAATAFGVTALMAGLAVSRMITARLAVGLLIIVTVLGLVVLVASGDGVFLRLANAGITDGERGAIYALTLAGIGDAPWSGFGLGAFEPAFALYRDASVTVPAIVDYAHGVHLEILFDLGLPATLALYFALAWVVLACAAGLTRRRRDQVYPAVALASAILLGVHGLVDFSVQMPAVAVTLALLLGIGFAQSFSTAAHRSS